MMDGTIWVFYGFLPKKLLPLLGNGENFDEFWMVYVGICFSNGCEDMYPGLRDAEVTRRV